MTVSERIGALQRIMKQKNVDIYIVPTADFHQSEYVGEHFKMRKFLTGFSGSAGTAVFTQDDACLWVDGRYFIQAARQIEGTPVRLMKMGEPHVPTIPQFLEDTLPVGGVIGFDGRCVSLGDGMRYEEIAAKKNGRVSYGEDLYGE